jgi:hypothetical protein
MVCEYPHQGGYPAILYNRLKCVRNIFRYFLAGVAGSVDWVRLFAHNVLQFNILIVRYKAAPFLKLLHQSLILYGVWGYVRQQYQLNITINLD